MSRNDGDRESFSQISSFLPNGKKTGIPERPVATWRCACGQPVDVTPLGLAALADANRLLQRKGQPPIDPRPPCDACRAKSQAERSRYDATLRQTGDSARRRLLAGPRPELAERSDWEAVRAAWGEAEVRRVDEERRKGHRRGEEV
jgi:hypothetical protein